MRARRTPVIDEYVEGGESAVFVGGNVVVLSALPTLVLSALAEDWRDLAELEPILVEAFGAPADGTVADALAAVVGTLVARGMVEIS